MNSYNIVEITPSCLYDSCELPETTKPGVSRYLLFCKPLGKDPQKDLAITTDGWFTRWLRTNMLEANTLPAPHEFIVKRLNLLFLQDGRPLRLHETDLYGKSAVRFLVNQKSYWESPALQCASPLAVFEVPKEHISSELWKSFGAVFERPQKWAGAPCEGIYLSWQEFFSVDVDIAGPIPEKAQLAVHLDGPLARAVM